MGQPRASAAYFREQLNYTLGDEDSSVELAILPEGARHVLSIAGSGGRVLPLLARAPRQLTCVDISLPQLHLTELRLAAARELSHAEYLGLFGYPPVAMSPEERARHFQRLALSSPAQQFLQGLFEALSWSPPLYVGRFERMLKQLAGVNRLFTGKAGRGLFEARSREEQAAYLRDTFPHTAFKAVLLLLGNSAVLNSLLYKGDFPKKNIPGSAYAIYRDIFSRLFQTFLARESFFLQLAFFGELRFPEGNPIECEPDVYARAQAALKRTEIRFVQDDILELGRREPGAIDFVSLSDVPSFLKGPREVDFLQTLRPGLAPGALVVTRGHLRIPRPETTGYELITSSYEDVVRRERTQLWQVQVYRKSA